ncbi:polyprenyl synthetase family protein [Alkalicoccus daliensis]|uniref:Farnesyl diphosphate synthase n=1 Tax=Alkalicoccus daliensis TaxID=745820 RepID=A0A1H0B4G5_9BACI|nr:farnesyl diphosphate synthase [Alkalicoccus daliensis]SDN40550.1 geranylgeranyl diphosphate synthase, type II [Alkalicoccus daliensis]
MTNLQNFIEVHKERVENLFPEIIESLHCSSPLKKSMLYSLQAGGKRVRPMLLYAVLDSYKIDKSLGDNAAAALEMIHTYSLIHDDLPAMDDDDLRRGKPTNHKVFGEATAILAGDALLTHSFYLIASDDRLSTEVKIEIIKLLSFASGANGMVGGQTADMEAEGKSIDVDSLEKIHTHKTGDLLAVALQIGAAIAGASPKEQDHLYQFGKNIGLSFQIKDDLLDVEGDQEIIGKPVGSDEDNEKNTYVKLLGLNGAKEKLAWHTQLAMDELSGISADTGILKALAQYIGERSQ